MNLPFEETQLFYRLYWNVLAYANRKLKVLPQGTTWEEIARCPMEQVADLRDAFWANPEILERFLADEQTDLSREELAIVASWRHCIRGDFYIIRYLKKYTVFLSAEGEAHLYGVLGLFDPIQEIFPVPLPVLVNTVLLPFQGRIVYDGLLRSYAVAFGAGIKRSLNETYRRLKKREGIIESLVSADGTPEIRTSLSRRKKASPAPDWSPVLQEIADRLEKIRRTNTPLQGAAVSLLRAAAAVALAAFSREDPLGQVLSRMRRLRAALTRLERVLDEEREYGSS